VDAADRVHYDAAAAILARPGEHLLPQPLNQQRVFADQHRPQLLFDHVAGGTTAHTRLADADYLLVGLDLDEERAAPRLHAAGTAVGRLAPVGQRDPPGSDQPPDDSPRSAPPPLATRPPPQPTAHLPFAIDDPRTLDKD